MRGADRLHKLNGSICDCEILPTSDGGAVTQALAFVARGGRRLAVRATPVAEGGVDALAETDRAVPRGAVVAWCGGSSPGNGELAGAAARVAGNRR